MKKVLWFFFILGIGAVLITGCQQASSPTATLDPSTAAAAVGQAVSSSLTFDSLLGFSAMSVQSVKAQTTGFLSPEADGWWGVTLSSLTFDSQSVSIEAHLRLYASTGALIDTQTEFGQIGGALTLDKLYMYGTLSYSGIASFTVNLGNSKADPFKIEGLSVTGGGTVSGTVSNTTIANGETLVVSMTYNAVTLSASGYPNGTVDFSITYAGTTYAGTITFNGTALASMTFTQGLTGTYTINLITGMVTTASL